MSEWVISSHISDRLGYKTLLTGLSEAGKTAVKRIFFLKQSTADVDNLRATLNYERFSLTIRDSPVNIVDLGGQKIFLKKFLGAFTPFIFNAVNSFLFLIDVANEPSYQEAIPYFAACVKRLDRFSPDARIFVFLHKNDLIRQSSDYEEIHDQLKERFQREYPRGPVFFFRTSIYSPETIVDGFGRIIEIAMPDLANSEFVEGRTIGAIEEFDGGGYRGYKELIDAEQIGISSSSLSEKLGDERESIKPKIAGDPRILSELRSLMKDALNVTGKMKKPRVAGDPKIVQELRSLMKQALKTTRKTEFEPTPVDIPPSFTSVKTIIEKAEAREASQVDQSIELEKFEGIIKIPETNGLGLEVDYAGSNIRVTFYDFKTADTPQIVNGSVISPMITIEELIYLIAYELDLPSKGFLIDEKPSIEFTAQLIYEIISQVKKMNLVSSTQIPSKKKTDSVHTIKLQLPMELEVDTEP